MATERSRPSVFIGSSTEGLPLARAIKAQLSDEADVSVWNEGLFPLGSVTLDELVTFSYRFDFAVLVLTPDDQKLKQDSWTDSVRDNVLFELGMFMSTLGKSKTFIVKEKTVAVPSDLSGVTYAELEEERPDHNVDARVGTACHKIRTAIDLAYHKSSLGLLPSTALAVGYYLNFVDKVCLAFSDPRTKLKLQRDGEERALGASDLRDKEITFTVVIPDDFAAISHESLQQIKFEHHDNIWDVKLETPSREFPFYTFARTQGDKALEFFDLPTTLRTSFEAIKYCIGPTIGTDAVLNLIRRREIDNFRETIVRLSQDQATGKYVRTAKLEYFA